MASIPFELQSPRPLVGLIDLPEEPGPAPVVVLCHGFKGFAEWGFLPPLAALLAERGLAAVRFNFGDSGMRLGDELVTDLDAFRRQTISGEVDDLLAVVAAARLAEASRDESGRLRALVTWAAVSHLDRLPADEVQRWRETGTWTAVNARTGQRLPVGLELLRDVEAHGEEIDPRRAAARRRAPWLIVHGDRDETVPVAEGDALAAAAAPPVELLRIEGGDHTFGAKTPFAGPNPHLIAAMNATQTWLLRWLRA